MNSSLYARDIYAHLGFVQKGEAQEEDGIRFIPMEYDRTMEYYNQIFKRKSFHLFRGAETISDDELATIQEFVKTVTPLDDSIRTEIRIVPESVTSGKRGAQYCIEMYSEEKGDYLRNIGYMGEQIDLWLASRNIGALWYGIGKPDIREVDGLGFVIMIVIAKMPETKFRKDMFKAKRKPLEEIWCGDTIEDVSEIVRFAPSACNSQPWIVNRDGDTLSVFRYKKAGKRGIMPKDKVTFYNRIDTGIFLYMLEICLKHQEYSFKRELFHDEGNDDEMTLNAKYFIK